MKEAVHRTDFSMQEQQQGTEILRRPETAALQAALDH
jgi:hypothetical protein